MEFKISRKPVPYEQAVKLMEKRVSDIIDGKAEELIWFLEHPHIYTCGTSADPEKEVLRDDVPIYKSGRGGKVTYHGPGQQVVYIMLDLRKRGKDIRKFVHDLESWLSSVFKDLGINVNTYEDRIGLWVKDKHTNPNSVNSVDNIFTESKIAAIGVRVRRWVTFHGVSINNNPDLSYFDGIVPCGLKDYKVTSLSKMGIDIKPSSLQKILKQRFIDTFADMDKDKESNGDLLQNIAAQNDDKDKGEDDKKEAAA